MIDVNIQGSRAANNRLPILRDDIGYTTKNLTRLLDEIDVRILKQNNLFLRLDNSRKATISLSKDIHELHTAIISMLNKYESTDQQLKADIARRGVLEMPATAAISQNQAVFNNVGATPPHPTGAANITSRSTIPTPTSLSPIGQATQSSSSSSIRHLLGGI